jgi:creatinine amidohydrolase
MRIGEMSWTQVREAASTGLSTIVPLGSIEEHGPHAPMGDYVVIDNIAGRTGEQTGDLVVPTLPFGYSEYFRMYPGTITLRPETLSAVVEDTLDCLLKHDVSKIVIFNGHAGNMPILELLIRKFRRERGLVIPVISPLQIMQAPALVKELYGEGMTMGHGGEPMGSIFMALAPGKVDLGRGGEFGRAQVFGMPTEGLGVINVNGVRASVALDMTDVTPSTGSLSDPSLASAEKGQRFLDYAVEKCVEFMTWFRGVDPKLG